MRSRLTLGAVRRSLLVVTLAAIACAAVLTATPASAGVSRFDACPEPGAVETTTLRDALHGFWVRAPRVYRDRVFFGQKNRRVPVTPQTVSVAGAFRLSPTARGAQSRDFAAAVRMCGRTVAERSWAIGINFMWSQIPGSEGLAFIVRTHDDWRLYGDVSR